MRGQFDDVHFIGLVFPYGRFVFWLVRGLAGLRLSTCKKLRAPGRMGYDLLQDFVLAVQTKAPEAAKSGKWGEGHKRIQVHI